MNSLILISPSRGSGFQPILSGNMRSGRRNSFVDYKADAHNWITLMTVINCRVRRSLAAWLRARIIRGDALYVVINPGYKL
ncbi:MAG: hypothetical protein JGK24_01940 [Microcoleus sp. PH2017_29_MFU_D_A]|uniref:hypothetical protein n=1 Tax=unclassified Microcoleus TaxID=2642155 RepID=UPI001D40886A|nr:MULTISPECIES: hypothetical protein [unclassified Microcoleus]MCC3422114.1 hypothetical protein [Microcoleus sp. PH2017_07_MST_O_A]MCC3430602.1 hypothetical protein [Microcoleus sp. PH2017_04_SCI_O_A]MCC3445207.1 hypothetical protein [Microcoleus sp. PH2017_03_ELD_O_A]MCC3468883.1 hypothetical protein [Microcoleus sp. PH2017_06_SFM_O_A]MCC3502044.1 hypothetical protein [Microcoleus sp. PH2017_19_SFW_U_A]MCC3508686.1 hypothetical protein [Microcoleus sp. PH2017_17_BER_D_A]